MASDKLDWLLPPLLCGRHGCKGPKPRIVDSKRFGAVGLGLVYVLIRLAEYGHNEHDAVAHAYGCVSLHCWSGACTSEAVSNSL